MTKFILANPCQNKESKQKETKEMLMMSFQHVPLFWNVTDPVKPLNSNSAQIIFDITIWNGPCLLMHGQYIL